eukprot:766411-Hanusia_phi.AAC.4
MTTATTTTMEFTMTGTRTGKTSEDQVKLEQANSTIILSMDIKKHKATLSGWNLKTVQTLCRYRLRCQKQTA